MGGCQYVVAIEVLEPFISKWMFHELKHVLEVLPGDCVHIYNVRRECEVSILAGLFGYVSQRSITESGDLQRFDRVLVLDPRAERALSPGDFSGRVLVVVGGIMGSHPPSGRTHRELTSRLSVGEARNIGAGQYTIDGAVYVASEVAKEKRLDEIPFVDGLTLTGEGFEVFLPYRYPLRNGAPFISEEEKRYILEELEEDEYLFLSQGRPPAIC